MPQRKLIPSSTWNNNVTPPPLSIYSQRVQRLIRRLKTPLQVQRWLLQLQYNPQDTMRNLHGVAHHRRAHCLEAVLAAAAILEQHGYPPLILDLDSADDLAHTLFLYRRRGQYGTIGFSRDIGLNGRQPVYQNVRTLVQSYAAPYIDRRACSTGYGVLDLRQLPHSHWRTSKRNVWFVEDALDKMPHRRLNLSPAFVRTWRRRYLEFKKLHPRQQPTIYRHQENWV
jgi:hypothetical protein